MKKILTVLLLLFVALSTGCSEEIIDNFTPEIPETPSCEIHYTTTDEKIISSGWLAGLRCISNTYENGQGIMVFDGDITAIRNMFMYSETRLKSIVLPSTVTTIGNEAFYLCSSLESVFISDGVTTIGEKAFRGTAITEIVIPNSVVLIDNEAFASCYKLESVKFDKATPNIDYNAFLGCKALKSVYITDLSRWFDMQFLGFTYQGASASSPLTNGATLYLNSKPVTEVTVPKGISTLANGVFFGCSSIVSVSIPAHVTEIEAYACTNCSNLKSIYCHSLTPPTPKPLDWWNGMGGTYYRWNPFGGCAEGCKIYVPRSAVEAYKTTPFWSNYASMIEGYDF